MVAPAYTNDRYNSSSRNAMLAGSVIDEPVVEHEHHHIHHHIDHGTIDNKALTLAGKREIKDYSYDRDETIDRERRVGGSISVASSRNHNHNREHRYHNHRHRHRSGNNSRVDLSMSSNTSSRRGSVAEVSGTTDWAVIDVPPGTRRITIETSGSTHNDSREDINVSSSWSRNSGVRRSRGLGSELWTEITKDLITREAIEELKYPFEETEYFYYIFEYLHQDQIRELIELTADIRHERVKDLEFSRIANTGPAYPPPGTHYIEDREVDREVDRYAESRRAIEERPEVVYTDERTTRRSRKYYY